MNMQCAALSDRFISITGPDASKFLQGQASCDIDNLSDTRFSFGTLNTPKGRMYCLFKVIKIKDGLLLSMNASLLEKTLTTLNKYAVFFKCTLTEETSYRAAGIFVEDNYDEFLSAVNTDDNAVFSLSQHQNAYWLNLSSKKHLCVIWYNEDEGKPNSLKEMGALSKEEWLSKETCCGIPELYDNSSEEFILQTLNLQKLGAVSFKKGCYTGQEIIARMKFLGKVKKQCYLLKSNSQDTASPMDTIYDAEGNKCGTVVRSHTSSMNGTCALCILTIERALQYNALYLDESLTQPYTVEEIDYSEYTEI